MTMQTHSSYQMSLNDGNALLMDLNRRLQELQTTQAQTKKRYTNWRAIAAKPQAANPHADMAGPMMGMIMAGLMESLFGGLPLFQMADGMVGQGLEGLTAMSVSGAMDDHSPQQNLRMVSDAKKSGVAAKFNRSVNAQKARERQAQMLQQMTMLLLMQMMQQQAEGGESGGDDEIVPDVLRHPKVARFQQNKHSQSMYCIREMFSRHTEITAPRFRMG